MKKDFAKAIFGKTDAREILVTFTDGATATYTENIIDFLKSDKSVDFIADAKTGEIIFAR